MLSLFVRAGILSSYVVFTIGHGLLAATANDSPAAGTTFVDSLQPNPSRPVGKTLNKSEVTSECGGKWIANKEVIETENGVTATAPATAHLAIPGTAGKIHVEADVWAKGTSFVGLALGRGDLTNLFWQNLGVMLVIWNDGRYNLFAAGKNQIETPEKGVLYADGPNHAELLLDTVARTVTLRLNGKLSVLRTRHSRIRSLWIKSPPPASTSREPVTAGQPLVSNFRVERTSMSASGLEPVDYAECFVVPREETTLRWRPSDPGPKKEIPYAINDYWGKKIADGTATKEEDGTFVFRRVFPRGYAEIVFPESGQTFGLVSLESHAGPADPFFCLDASLTWLELNPLRREGLVRIMARSGIAMARERFDGPFGPTPGSYNWEAGGRKMGAMRQTYAASPVSILRDPRQRQCKIRHGQGAGLPAKSPRSWPPNGVGSPRHFDNVWAGAEVYNEPDLKTEPAGTSTCPWSRRSAIRSPRRRAVRRSSPGFSPPRRPALTSRPAPPTAWARGFRCRELSRL